MSAYAYTYAIVIGIKNSYFPFITKLLKDSLLLDSLKFSLISQSLSKL